jgi:nucleoid DNA-binding protein
MLSKVDLVRMMHEKYPKISMKEMDTMIDNIFEIITKKLSENELIQIDGFGTFGTTEKMIRPVVKIKKVVNEKK